VGTNDAVIDFESGMTAEYQISSILIKGATGSQAYTMLWEDNTTTYSNNIVLPSDIDTWRRLIFITAGKTLHKLTLFPTDTAGGVLYFADAMTFDGDLEAISNFYQNGQVNIRHEGIVASAEPATGTWEDTDIIYKANSVAGDYIGWVCTTAGTPGTWREFGAIL
jgi:hypothetical protein